MYMIIQVGKSIRRNEKPLDVGIKDHKQVNIHLPHHSEIYWNFSVTFSSTLALSIEWMSI